MASGLPTGGDGMWSASLLVKVHHILKTVKIESKAYQCGMDSAGA